MDLFVSQRSCFWANGTKAQNSRGRAVKDDRRGGHRSAQAPSPQAALKKEPSGCGRAGGSRAGRPARSLTARGMASPTQENSVAAGIDIRPQAVAPGGERGRSRSRKQPERSAARKHPTATTAGCPNSMEVCAALGDSTPLIQQRSRIRIARGMVLLTIRWGLTLSHRVAYPHEDYRRRRARLAINSECEWTLRAL